MADKMDEKAIPVFTVLKNNAILKNIFLLDTPPPFPGPKLVEPRDFLEIEETLLVGRHPDCNITLEHPSISRFHLRIHSNPSSYKLSVTDLSSVHGTWVSGKKIEAGVRVEMNEGDAMQLGGSSRVYRLHWVPLSRAYDMENPFVSPLDVSAHVEEGQGEGEGEGEGRGEGEARTDQDYSEPLLSNVSAPSFPEYMNSPSFSDGKGIENQSTATTDHEHKEISSLWSGDNQSPQPCVATEIPSEVKNLKTSCRELELNLKFLETMESSFSHEQLENQCPLGEGEAKTDQDYSEPLLSNVSAPSFPEYMNSPSFPDEKGIENQSTSMTDHEHKEISSLWSGDNQSPQPCVATEIPSEVKNLKTSCRELELNLKFLEAMESSFSHEQLENQCPLREEHQIAAVLQIVENQDPLIKDCEQREILESLNNSPLSDGNVLSHIENQQFNKANRSPHTLVSGGGSQKENPESPLMNSEQKSNLPCIWSRRGKPFSVLQIQTGRSRRKSEGRANRNAEAELLHDLDGNVLSHIENQQFNKANRSPNTLVSGGVSQKENPESPLMNSEQKSNLPCIWSRRGKPFSVLQIQTGRSRRKSEGRANRNAEVELPHDLDIEDKDISKALFTSSDGEDEVFTPDKENFTPSTLILRSMKNMGMVEETKDLISNKSSSLQSKVISKGLLTGLDHENEEPFTPDKENFTPNTLLIRSMKKKCKMEEIKYSNIIRSSSFDNAVNHNHFEEDNVAPSVKENQTPKVLKEQKSLKHSFKNEENLKADVVPMKSGVERMPFQPLLENSCGKSKSDTSVLGATENGNYVNYVQTIEKKKSTVMNKNRWSMVVDNTCFLDKESRKALQLLQGLKGTQLIVPRIVIRELDCLNRRGSLFRRKTEASYALQWIEDCMVSTKWWIHVQSSEDEGRPIASTPPASPKTLFREGNSGFPGGAARLLPFSPWGSLHQIVSPTAEDHILEYALLFGRNMNHGQFVLLTNDVTMKVKAMAEGLMCETAEEFRKSLVNPFSERFLWTDSSPRGPTWCCEDDVILREKYCSGPMRKPSKTGDGARGLKLVLLHNSRYGQTLVS